MKRKLKKVDKRLHRWTSGLNSLLHMIIKKKKSKVFNSDFAFSASAGIILKICIKNFVSFLFLTYKFFFYLLFRFASRLHNAESKS